jgi:hypothetical protein
MKWAYYNDNDPYVCQWVKNLIAAGHIMPGEVDCRPIQEVELNWEYARKARQERLQ